MSNSKSEIKSYKVVYPQIYSYTLPERKANDGSQKIGYTEKENVDERILQQVNTAAFSEPYNKLWSGAAYYEGNKESFTDKDFHKFLEKYGIERRTELGREWFYFNGEPLKSKALFDLFRKQGFIELQNSNAKLPYTLRFEQEKAVKSALAYFQNTENGEFLWNAKPRFGKTLASYDLAKQLEAKTVLIVTNRPAIANSWFDDYERFVDGYFFISETNALANRATLTRKQYIDNNQNRILPPQITFLSLQDLKGSRYFGGDYEKLKWVADLKWDLLIIDEAHEGIDTSRTDFAFDVIKRKNTLHLSGTPFKALANDKFKPEAIFNWTYLDEQKIKQLEIEEGETGEHTDMPDLRLFTYRISQMITKELNEGIEIDNENFDYAFDLNEFFRVQNKKFVHEADVKEFLKNLTTNEKYPFSTDLLRNELKHTFWYVGNRVESVKALEQLLKKDPVFSKYEIIVAAGNGQSFEEEENDFKGNESSFKRVKDAISKYDKTITLSCGQLTTGVTIKEWSAVLMLTDIKSPSLYMQAAFRAQNPYKEFRDGKLVEKQSAYLFDFAPTRVLEIYEKFANGLNPKAVNGQITEQEREENVKELINFFPVISEDVNGEMVELDANKVLTFPNALAAVEIVNARFMTNLLFNDTIKGVFNFPKEVEDILNKMPEEKNKRAIKTNSTLDLDEARKVNDNRTTKITENTDIILGEKIFKSNTERVADNELRKNSEYIIPEDLAKSVYQAAEPLVAKYKEVYKPTKAEEEATAKLIQEKVKLVAEEYNNAEVKDSEVLKQKLIAILEGDFVGNKVAEKEEAVVAKVQKTKEDEIRDRLRSFTRTIPMFIMANSSKEEITIDNFDLEIADKDFVELTSITKEEFHKLRDGFDYEENGIRKTFQGVFNKYRFNASIAEFKAKKEQLANYFTSEEDIFELIPNQKTNQIFTPKKVVQMMVNQLEEHEPSLFTRTDSTFIDLYMKSGMYITEIVKKLFNNTKNRYETEFACLKHILENQVYGLSPTPILQGITQAYIFGFDTEKEINRKNFVQHDLTPDAQKELAKEKLQELLNLNESMKFDVVVGNPPYQEVAKGSSSSDDPIYHLFMKVAYKLGKKACLITPARFLFNAGKTPKNWNLEMLNNPHLKVVSYQQKSTDLFPGTDIKGGVAITYYDKTSTNGPIGVFTSYNELNSVVEKVVKTVDFKSIMSIIETQNKFNLDELYKDYPNYKEIIGNEGKDRRLRQVIMERLDVFSIKPSGNEDYRICGRIQGQRVFRFIPKRYIEDNIIINKYKVFVTSANGTGALGEKLSTPFIGEPLVGITQTFISFGCFDSESEALAALKYIKSKFARTLLGVLKITQGNNQETWAKVPLQDFTQNSDIDWTKSISEIDKQLYAKYKLSADEIAFIEEKVQPME